MRRIGAALLLLSLAVAPATRAQTTDFARLVDRLSEPGGYFDSDNLVSNETSYLHVMGNLRALNVHGGAYLGVGPEQSFSYIAEIQPEIAILIDIRRDNQLLHLLFKAMFETSRNRLEYLCLLFGRPMPPDISAWTDRSLDSLIAYIDRTRPDSSLHDRTHAALMQRVASYGIALSDSDRSTIRRFHDEFTFAGLDLTFRTLSRPNGRFYPNVRRLYTETDLEGNRDSYLATEERWERVRTMERAGRVVPVVGDLSGPKAMKAIGDYLRENNLTVSAFYVSNVEMYLFRAGTFPAFVNNVRALPAGPTSMIIRSWFNRGRFQSLPGTLPDQFSTQLLQTIPRFVALTERPDTLSYWSLVNDSSAIRP